MMLTNVIVFAIHRTYTSLFIADGRYNQFDLGPESFTNDLKKREFPKKSTRSTKKCNIAKICKRLQIMLFERGMQGSGESNPIWPGNCRATGIRAAPVYALKLQFPARNGE